MAAMDAATLIGSIAAALSVTSFAPQAWRIIKTREIKGLSAKMYVLTTLGFAMWTSFGLLKGEWPIIVPNSICFLFALFITAMILVSRPQREKIADRLDPDKG